MSKRIIVGDAEYLEEEDYLNLGKYPQDALDDVVGDAIGYPNHWAGFTVSSQNNPQILTISPGRLINGRLVYRSEEIQNLNLTTRFPLSSQEERWLALVVTGSTVNINAERAFETSTDPEVDIPVDIPAPITEFRKAGFSIIEGTSSVAPAVQPTIDPNLTCIAFIRVTTQGIQAIEPGEAWRAKTLYEVEGRVTSLELRLLQLTETTTTIQTDVANLAAGMERIPDPRLVDQVVRDAAQMRQELNLPDEARNYYFDYCLLPDFWDFTAGGFFRINEGGRFAYEAQSDHILRLLNYSAPDITVYGNRLVMPKYTEVTRISSPEGKGFRDISNTVHTVTTAVKKTKSHQRIRYGETINVCENTAGWAAVGSQKAGQIFKANGQTFVSKGQSSDPWNQKAESEGHKNYAVQRVIKDTYTTSYTTYNTETFGLSGAVYGQTFLSAQVMVATSIELNFTKVGADGDVMLVLCETNSSGAPNYEAVLANVTKPRAELIKGWNKFVFEPTLLDQGKRYGWFVVTTGNHQLMANAGNAFGGGSMFISSDGAWAQGSTTEDFTFRLNTAKFAASRVVMQFESLQLQGGMTEVEMVYQAWEPAATSLVWEIKAQGDDEWIPMDARVDNPLKNLPPLVQLRAVFLGTEDVAPAINLDTYARAIAGRMRNDLRAISKLKVFGFGTAQAQIVYNMDAYDAARHTTSAKIILSSGTVVEPTGTIIAPDPQKPGRVKFTANFALAANTPSARARVDATTNSKIHVPFIQDIQLNAY